MTSEEKMDTNQVYLVRSSREKDMLCVGGFLYHYRDHTKSDYQWVCSKRRDKILPCRSRIVTSLIDGDLTQHRVLSVFGEHTHERCTTDEIEKAFDRKRLADFEKKPSSLLTVQLQQKLKRIEDFERSRNHTDMDGSDSNSEAGEEDDKNDSVNTPVNCTDDGELEFRMVRSESPEEHEESDCLSPISHLKRNKPYLLKNPQDRQFLCMDGFLYRLISWSKKTFVYTWKCARRCEESCPANLSTVRKADGQHKVKDVENIHVHEKHSPDKLFRVLRKYNLSFVFKRMQSNVMRNNDSMDNSMDADLMWVGNDDSLIKKARSTTHSSSPFTYKFESDPMKVLREDEQNAADRVIKFTFLTSAKGKNKVLCLDNYLYHFKQKAIRKAGHVYWTCMWRRHRTLKCNATVTTKTGTDGPLIVRLTGEHSHPPKLDVIKRRVLQDVVVKKATSTGMNSRKLVEMTLRELGDEFKPIVEKSLESIDRKVARARSRIIPEKSEKTQLVEDIDDSSSSFASALESDDDYYDTTNLPTNIDEMREKIDPIQRCVSIVLKDRSAEIPNADAYDGETPVDEEFLKKRIKHVRKEEDALAQNSCSDLNDHKQTVFRFGRKRIVDGCEVQPDMDITQVSILHSAKGGKLLCVDNFIYHIKEHKVFRTYWTCAKRKHPVYNCKSSICTTMTNEGIKILSVTNHHTHPSDPNEIERRIYKDFSKGDSKSFHMETSPVMKRSRPNTRNSAKVDNNVAVENFVDVNIEEMDKRIVHFIKNMKLYAVSDGPPSLAVRMTLKALDIQHELINVDYIAGDHMTKQYAEMNPQKEIPVLDDDGFYLSESIAIMQYLCDKYAPDTDIYPKDSTKRAIINHRLCFNMGFYYASISAHAMGPIFFDYKRTDMSLKKVKNGLEVFETYLKRGGTKYAAGDKVTIADFALVSSTLCLEAIDFDLSPYPLVSTWYETFKEENPKLWKIGRKGMKEIADFEQNPPDLSHMDHPFHPTRKPAQAPQH